MADDVEYARTSDAPYDQIDIHRRMLADKIRVTAFRKALEKAVKPGDTVLDVGTGTGILAMLAVRAGAKKVYAVEPALIVETARRVIKARGLEGAIELFTAGIENAELPGKADVIVWEWMGGFGVDEGMLPLFLLARDRWLKLGGRMIPEAVSAWMAPAFDAELKVERDFWVDQPYGIDYSSIWDREADEWHYGRHHIKTEDLLAAPQRLWVHDSYRTSHAESCARHDAMAEFRTDRAGPVNCLAVWFESVLFGDVVLSNAPAAPPTHWGRVAFPLDRTCQAEKGTAIRVNFTFQANGMGPCKSGLSVRVGDADWEKHNDHRIGGSR
jgi:SAM-dependent methyltransferase